jgi:hypothetical protein
MQGLRKTEHLSVFRGSGGQTGELGLLSLELETFIPLKYRNCRREKDGAPERLQGIWWPDG